MGTPICNQLTLCDRFDQDHTRWVYGVVQGAYSYTDFVKSWVLGPTFEIKICDMILDYTLCTKLRIC